MIKELHNKLVNGEITATQLTEDFLNTLQEKNGELNAVLTVAREEALAQAKRVDEKIVNGEEIDFMAGIPVTVKDVIVTEGVRTTAGSKMLENYIASYDADIVKNIKEKGTVIIGKNNCDEFAMGGSSENSAFGPVKNPHDLSRVSGGSSGGSAVAVASGMSVCSLGTDTGGSIRQPASYCGVVGFKPSYGAVSRSGIIAMASSLDQAGPLTQTVEDARIVFDAMRGKSSKDATSFDLPKHISQFGENLQGLRVGVPKEFFAEGLDPEVRELVEERVKQAESLGAEIKEVSLPAINYALAVYYIIAPSEVSANMMRYDSIRYGERSQVAQDLFEVYAKSRDEFLGDEVKRRIMLGTYVLSAGYYDAYYKKAQQVRTLIRKDFARVFKEVDVLMTPVAPRTAFRLGEKLNDPLAMYLEDIYTVPVNIAGLPALSMPAGKTGEGLPVGLQIIGAFQDDMKVLEVGEVLQANE